MPKAGGRRFAYTPKGRAAARKVAAKKVTRAKKRSR